VGGLRGDDRGKPVRVRVGAVPQTVENHEGEAERWVWRSLSLLSVIWGPLVAAPVVQPQSLIKAFFAKPLGRIILLIIIALVLAGSAIYLGYLIAIPVFLLVGLALPIYLGWTRPRTLFLVGLSALLVAGPIVTAGTVSLLLTPSPAVGGPVFSPFTQSVFQNASVHPYYQSSGGDFTFTADVNPAFLPNGSQPKVLWIDFFLSTCPNALSNNSSACGGAGAYPYHFQNFTYNSSAKQTVQFVQSIGGVNVWWWTMGAGYVNSTGHINWVYLAPGNGYSTAEGPVTGAYLSIYTLILPAIYFTVFIYPGLVFFLGVLVYLFLKMRQRRRAGGAPSVPAPVVPSTSGTPATSSTPSPGAPSRPELACPNCGAVVYAGETRCWKCGTPLTSGPSPPASATDQPLPSGKQ
jgi:hypothetical protein